MVAETRRWVVRDLRGGADTGVPSRRSKESERNQPLLALIKRSGGSIEDWNDDQWESFTLRALWLVCREGVSGLPQFTSPPVPPVRHRDLLFEVTGRDTDLKVHELLIRFCASFLDQGLAHWTLPRRDEGFFRSFCSLYGEAGRPARSLAPGPGQGAGPSLGPGDQAPGVDARVARDPGRSRGRVGGVPHGHPAGPSGLGRHDSPGREPRRPHRPSHPRREPGRVPRDPVDPRPIRARP